MRKNEDFREILQLWEQGYNKKQISRLTDIPRATVRDCINRYGTVAGLEQAINKRAEQKADTQDRRKAERRKRTPKPRPWRYTQDELRAAVKESRSIAQTLDKLGIVAAGGNYETIKSRVAELSIDTSHFRGKGWSQGLKKSYDPRKRMADILVENSTYKNTGLLRQRLIKEGYFEHRCVSCELEQWLEQPIPLELDHINGDRHDNRLENLRLLCPNCHALTPTYRGRNMDPNNKT